jgi:hypothetical protein
MIAGSDIANGCASSLTEMLSRLSSRAKSARRVGSASAAKVRSSVFSSYLTIWFSITEKNNASSRLVLGLEQQFAVTTRERYSTGQVIPAKAGIQCAGHSREIE